MRKAGLTLSAAAAAAALVALAPGTPAIAQTTTTVYAGGAVRVVVPANQNMQVDCPQKWVCLYRDFNFRGTLWSWRGDRSVSYIGNGPNDRASSLINNAPKTVRFYEHKNYHGKHVCIGNWDRRPHNRIGDLRSYSINDKISSFKIGKPCAD